MSKAPRKSIVASFGLLSAALESSVPSEPAQKESPSAPSPSGGRVGAGVIGAAHRAIDDIRSERDRLKALVESGGGAIQELDPSLVDPSPFPDRLPDDDDNGMDVLRKSIEVEGQKVPIQVRKHPSMSGRYQIVYGHRRWHAAKALGKPVKAIEVELSDLDLVVAQGIENAARQDLTWIERALFASRMDDTGIKPRDIYAALAIEDAELARMRNVYRNIPADIIHQIGRAPKIGRPRWSELARFVAGNPEIAERVRGALSDMGATNSDARFLAVLSILKPESKSPEAVNVFSGDGEKLGQYVSSAKDVRISADGPMGRAFLRFVEAELPTLANRFLKEKDIR